jgi:hypothetical protein
MPERARKDIFEEPRRGEIMRLGLREVLVMGDESRKHPDGRLRRWVADLETGDRVDALVCDLAPRVGSRRDMHDALERVTAWARAGDGDAMWWLGHFHEFGWRGIGWNGAKALGYYLAAIHRLPSRFDAGSARRVLRDGDGLFPGRRPRIRDCTPRDHDAVYAHFPEVLHWRAYGEIAFPDPFDWRARVSSAEGFE